MIAAHRDHFFSVLEGKRPENMPFFPDITDWYVAHRTPLGQPRQFGAGQFIPDDAEIHKVQGMMPDKYKHFTFFDFYREFDWGLHVHIEVWYRILYSGDVRLESKQEQNTLSYRLLTPKGEMTRMYMMASDGTWCQKEYFVKDLKDLELMRYVVEHTHYEADYEKIDFIREQIGDRGQGDIVIARSPFGKLVHEYMGFENVVYALADNHDSMLEFMKIQQQKDLELVALAAQAPERLIILSDHADENLISPPQWLTYCVPYYKKVTAILHQAGKFVSTHLDGNFKGFFHFLEQPDFDLLDGCTPAPMFNYEVEELAAALPQGMSAFCGVPATLFCQNLPTEQILQFGERILTSLKGRGIVNIGDILPPNGDIEQVIALGEFVKSTWK